MDPAHLPAVERAPGGSFPAEIPTQLPAAPAGATGLADLHQQLQNGAGRLSVPRLASRWQVSHTDALVYLRRLMLEGYLVHLPDEPYLQITPAGHAVRTRGAAVGVGRGAAR